MAKSKVDTAAGAAGRLLQITRWSAHCWGMRRLSLPATLLLLAQAAAPAQAAFPGPLPVPSKGCGKQLPYPVNAPLDLNVPVADPILFNKFREYYLALPPGYNNTVPLPLVLSFHGFYDEAIDMQKTGASVFLGPSFPAWELALLSALVFPPHSVAGRQADVYGSHECEPIRRGPPPGPDGHRHPPAPAALPPADMELRRHCRLPRAPRPHM